MINAVEIKNLSFAYHDGTVALHDVSLDIAEGESVGVIGENGAGKSTLLLHLNGILRGRGKIGIFGLDMDDKNLPKIRRQVGLVFQDPDNQLFMPTVFEDVAFGPLNMELSRDEVEASVDRALRQVDMPDAGGRASHHLSLGEKRRISIATVLSMGPQLLVLDEPSSNLDPRHRRELIALINGLKKTKIIATHDIDLVRQCCGRVICFERGRLTIDGPVEEVLNNIKL